MSAVHAAARAGDVAGLQAALEADAECVKQTDSLRRTALHLAAWAGHAKIISMLLTGGANVHATAMDGITALAFASQNGHVEAAKQLLAGGAKVNVKDSKKQNTPLHLSASKGHLACVSYLLRKNADTRMKNKAGKTAFDISSSKEVRELLQQPRQRAPQSDGDDGGVDEVAVSTECVESVERTSPTAEVMPASAGSSGAESADSRGGGKRPLESESDSKVSTKQARSEKKQSVVKLSHLEADEDVED